MGIKPMPVSQCSGSQTAENMKAKWLDINKGLKDKDTCMIWRAAFEYTHTRAPCFLTKTWHSILECEKGEAGSCVIFGVN
jgi:hypothetical protein